MPLYCVQCFSDDFIPHEQLDDIITSINKNNYYKIVEHSKYYLSGDVKSPYTFVADSRFGISCSINKCNSLRVKQVIKCIQNLVLNIHNLHQNITFSPDISNDHMDDHGDSHRYYKSNDNDSSQIICQHKSIIFASNIFKLLWNSCGKWDMKLLRFDSQLIRQFPQYSHHFLVDDFDNHYESLLCDICERFKFLRNNVFIHRHSENTNLVNVDTVHHLLVSSIDPP